MKVFTDETKYRQIKGASAGEEDKGVLEEYGIMERSIAYDSVTNNRIALLAASLLLRDNHQILVISKYTEQCKAIYQTLLKWGLYTSLYIGKDRDYDGRANIIVGSVQLTLTAFDQANSGKEFDRRFTAAILCNSIAQDGNMWQGVGRIMRAPEHEKPVFVWLQYPMKAYEKHTDTMNKLVIERQLKKQGHYFVFPKEHYDSFFEESIEIPINRSKTISPHCIWDLPEEFEEMREKYVTKKNDKNNEVGTPSSPPIVRITKSPQRIISPPRSASPARSGSPPRSASSRRSSSPRGRVSREYAAEDFI